MSYLIHNKSGPCCCIVCINSPMFDMTPEKMISIDDIPPLNLNELSAIGSEASKDNKEKKKEHDPNCKCYTCDWLMKLKQMNENSSKLDENKTNIKEIKTIFNEVLEFRESFKNIKELIQ